MLHEIKPSENEVKSWLLSTLRHSCLIEFYLHELEVGKNDTQRPHDIVGKYNKFSWPIIRGLALEYKEGASDREQQYIDATLTKSIRLHEQQYHHRMWLGPDKNSSTPDPNATEDDLMLGAVDAICTHLNGRLYNGGAKSWAQIAQIIAGNGPEHASWMREAFHQMKSQKSHAPDLTTITLNSLPEDQIGLPTETYNLICIRIDQTLRMLNGQHEYKL